MSTIAQAGEESHINDLLNDGGTVTLENRVYEVTGPIFIHSDTVCKLQNSGRFSKFIFK
jgi:hypothetical protein